MGKEKTKEKEKEMNGKALTELHYDWLARGPLLPALFSPAGKFPSLQARLGWVRSLAPSLIKSWEVLFLLSVACGALV